MDDRFVDRSAPALLRAIADALHGGPTQDIAAAMLLLDRMIERAPDAERAAELERVRAHLGNGMRSARDIMRALEERAVRDEQQLGEVA